jgi:hypothetical protein
MALTAIAGNINIPTGAAPNSARLLFTLATWDMNNDVVWAPDPIEEPLTGTAYSLSLESTTDKQRKSAYRVELSWYSTAKRATLLEVLGVIAVPISPATFDLPDLLAVPITEPVPADILALAQAAAISSAVNANIAGEAAIEAVEARDTVVALVEGFDGTFYIDAISGGRGPYAISADPVDARAMLLTLNGLRLIAPDHFEIVTMASPSGVGVLFTEDQVEGMRADYRIVLPTSAAVAADVFRTGNGLPEGAVSADRGTLYLQRDGSADGTIWVKNAGSGATGWVQIRHKYRITSSSSFSATGALTKEVGSSTVATAAQFHIMSLSAGAGAYDVTVTLSATNAVRGDYFDFYLNLPAGVDRRIIFLNGTGGPEILTAFSDVADRFKGRFVYHTSGWISAGFSVCVFD